MYIIVIQNMNKDLPWFWHPSAPSPPAAVHPRCRWRAPRAFPSRAMGVDASAKAPWNTWERRGKPWENEGFTMDLSGFWWIFDGLVDFRWNLWIWLNRFYWILDDLAINKWIWRWFTMDFSIKRWDLRWSNIKLTSISSSTKLDFNHQKKWFSGIEWNSYLPVVSQFAMENGWKWPTEIYNPLGNGDEW